MPPWCFVQAGLPWAGWAVAATMHHCCQEGGCGLFARASGGGRQHTCPILRHFLLGLFGNHPGGCGLQGRTSVCPTLHSDTRPPPFNLA